MKLFEYEVESRILEIKKEAGHACSASLCSTISFGRKERESVLAGSFFSNADENEGALAMVGLG